MTAWDVVTWLAVVVLGPGAVIVFAAFLRDLLRPEPPRPDQGDDGPSVYR